MNKDVIYIDVDDDITAIIGKVKASSEQIVALVPPKRVGVLQSVVNLRILNHAAKGAKKRLVLISNDQALNALAGSLKIPVAKNLQSKPEVPVIPALKVDNDDDIIDGAELPVGEHAATAHKSKEKDVSFDDIDIDGDEMAAAAAVNYAKPPEKGKLPAKPNKVKKVPNFNNFRKKLLIGGAVLLLLIGFFVWATIFAPRATVVISAKTHQEAVSSSVQLMPNQQTDASKGILHSVVVSEKKENSVEFAATGTKEVGEKSSGTLTLTRSMPGDKSVPAGSGFSNGDCTLVTTSDVVVPGASPGGWNGSGFDVNAGKVDVQVRATEVGEQCNLSARSYQSTVSGISADGGDMTGGSKKTVKIVTQEDIQKASEELVKQDEDEQKSALQQQFGDDVYVIEDSFSVKGTGAEASSKVGEEASDGKATLKSTITYSMSGVNYSDLKQFITEAIESKLSKENTQRVYDAGERKAELSDFKAGSKNEATVSVSANGQVGPEIDIENVKTRVKGKQFGDIQSDLTSISGVKDVQVDMFPFWLKTVPSDSNKIVVKFDLKDNAN